MLGLRLLLSSVACTFLFSLASAQAPAAAAPAAGAAQAGAPAAAAGVPAPSFCEQCWQACEDCKRRLCAMPLGAMLNGMTKPLNGLSGGIIPNFCPDTPSKDDLAKSGVEGASAQAKKDAMEAKARRQAVRYLGTLDCRYYPEAEAGLIAALRTDGVECVRWEAAMAMGRGCCCSKKIIEALTISVSGSEKDGNPAEHSERVRMTAAVALDRCLACHCEPVVEVEKPVEKQKEMAPPPREKPPTESGSIKSSRSPDKQTIAAGKAALKNFYGHYGLEAQSQIHENETVRLTPVPSTSASVPVTLAARPVSMPVKQRGEPKSLYGIFKESLGSGESTVVTKNMTVTPMNKVANNPATTVIFDATPPRGVMPNAVAASTLKPATPVPNPKIPSTPTPGATFIFFDTPESPATPKR